MLTERSVIKIFQSPNQVFLWTIFRALKNLIIFFFMNNVPNQDAKALVDISRWFQIRCQENNIERSTLF